MDATASTTSASAEPTTTSGKRSDRLSIKFLISNSLAGVLIGSGGTAIKDLIDISGARVIVSSISDVYPGTSDRIALISGSQASVDLAQRLVWDMIATATVANEGSSSTGEKKTFSWNPRTAHENLERHNDTNVSGRVTISAAAAGLILGKGGASLRAISEEGGARLQMNSKDESIFTHERIISISGSTEACARSLTAVINKLSEDLSSAQFLNSGVTYTTHINPHSITGGIHAQTSGDGRRGRGRSVRGAPAARDNAASSSEVAASEISTSTEITINIPDSAIGNILGKQVDQEFFKTIICKFKHNN